MRLLLSPPDGLFHAPMDNLSNEAFASVYAIASHWDRWVRASMVSTVDGSAVGADGLSGSINTPADHIAFKVNRALSDLVFVGAGTVRTEVTLRCNHRPSSHTLDRPRGFRRT